jgi:hypothetical protein
MATITLAANTNVSALTLANGDTINCNGFRLTIDVQPAQTNVNVISPGTNGTLAISGAWNLSTWDFTAGTALMLDTLPAGVSVGTVTGGSSSNARVFNNNNGTINNLVHGSDNNTGIGTNTAIGTIVNCTGSATVTSGHGCSVNNGIIVNANGGQANNAKGVLSNNGTITNATGGGHATAGGVGFNNNRIVNCYAGTVGHGCETNNQLIESSFGGQFANAHGCNVNNGTILQASGGASLTSFAIGTNNGLVLALTDSPGRAVSVWNGNTAFVFGPNVNGIVRNNIKTIYSLGALSGSATIASDATVITLSEGTGTAGFTGIEGISRSLGT